MMSRDERKTRGLGKFFNSFKYPISGLRYAYKNEQNLFVDIIITVIVLTLAIVFKITRTEWIIVIFLIGLVIATELINTSIEAVVDLVTQDYHPLAKVAKDTSASVVLVFSLVAAICGIMVFLPYVLALFK